MGGGAHGKSWGGVAYAGRIPHLTQMVKMGALYVIFRRWNSPFVRGTRLPSFSLRLRRNSIISIDYA